MPPRRFMIIAGETSGDTLGAELVKALRASPALARITPQFFGAGGPRLAAEGVEMPFDLSAHAVVGIVEVLKNYPRFKAFFNQLLELALQRLPDIVILIDYPGFNLRFAKALQHLARRASSIWKPKVVYYVSPQIWAWHQSRIHQIARDIDLLLTIFPFEKDWYYRRKPKFRVEFVGHPLVDRFKDFRPSEVLPYNAEPMLLLLPGSRVRELRQHLPAMIGAVRLLRSQTSIQVRMVIPSERLQDLAQSFISPEDHIHLQVGGLADSLAHARAAIASSGTVTLECAFFRVPTVVIYRTSWSTYRLGRIFIKVKFLAMPNLLADKEVFPELIQQDATPAKIAPATLDLLLNHSRRATMSQDLDRVIDSLGSTGASSRAASFILGLF